MDLTPQQTKVQGVNGTNELTLKQTQIQGESFQIMSPKRWTPCCNVMFKTFMLVCLYISSAGIFFFFFTLNGLQDTWR